MRAQEFSEPITERRRTWGIGDITLHFEDPDPQDPPGRDYHRYLRQIERHVSDQERDAILKQLPMVRRRMLEFTRGEKFWLYDPKLNKAVGLRVMDRQSKQYFVGTVFARLPAIADNVLHVPGTDPGSLEEGWRDTAAGLALGAGVALGSPGEAADVERVVVQPGQTVYSIARAFSTTPEIIRRMNRLGPDFRIEPDQELKVPVPSNLRTIDVTKKRAQPAVQPTVKPAPAAPRQVDVSRTRTGRPYEALLTNAARTAGILDRTELAAFLAQTSVESAAFAKLREVGDRQRIERMYDIKYNPRGAKMLGNTRPGDGWRYRGRGFIMLTGRDNYTRASRDLGIDLVDKPELLMQPEVAARVAVWYWKTRVRPNVTNFNDTRTVTRLVQGGSKALERRHDEFQDFKRFKMAQR